MKTLTLAQLKKLGFVKAIERPLEIVECKLADDAAAVLNVQAGIPGTLFIVIADSWESKAGKQYDKGTAFFIPA